MIAVRISNEGGHGTWAQLRAVLGGVVVGWLSLFVYPISCVHAFGRY